MSWLSPLYALDVQEFSPEINGLFRPIIIQQVLGTDMKKHFEILSRFQVSAWLCFMQWYLLMCVSWYLYMQTALDVTTLCSALLIRAQWLAVTFTFLLE